MNVTHMNEGHKVAYTLDGSILTIGESVVLDLDEEQEDVERVISVFAGDDGTLSEDGHNYAAVIIIPPRRYANEEVDEIIDGEEVVQIIPVAQPCQVAAVTLQLWSIAMAHAESEKEE
ncbi:hypothetical protein [Antarcticimicrobium sediminis]|uniref:Uncharacterized protein n=1 Tax=Antarcticimicrobium sediminis TaxID=2546227 RepID=A0A4R5EIG6_9RHOB|nr:hypothetical protein [Antarcticimicrobium sediminis]TDE34122.1 hypothetical protein E1B25_20240 [Antarcticimicrobium sediminis]